MSPGTVAVILHAAMILAVGLGIYLFLRSAGNDMLSRVIAAIVPVATLVLTEALLMRVLHAPFWDWNGARLTPTFAITHGYKLYYEPDAGPAMNFMYGPMAAYAYLPATLANTPTAAIIIASLIGLICFFGPVLWLLLQQGTGMLAKLFGLGAFVCFCFLSFLSSPLSYSGFSVHADAPALGLCACACAVLGLRKHPESTPIFIVSGLLATLAVWTKQTMVPILPGLIAYVWLADGRRCALRYTLWIFIAGVCVSLVFLALNDVRALIFNMFVKHLHHPLNHPTTGRRAERPLDNLFFLLVAARLLLYAAVIPLSVVIVYGAYQFHRTAGSGLSRVKQWVTQNPWLLTTIVGGVMIPTSIICRIGVGGDSNDQSPAVYFLAAGAALGLVKCATESAAPGLRLPQWIAKVLLGLLPVCFAYTAFITPTALSRTLEVLPYNPAQKAYELAKQYPDTIYFPGDPLSSLLADGKLYHFLMGLHERAMDGYPPSYEYFWEYLPTNTQLIVLPNPAWMKDYVEEFRPYLRRFSPPMRDPSGWWVYRREQ
ncbi:MAG TPA: hypothetical protein VL486_10310 [Verrucomicrobiae bacterium]|nr:hypothetical protein [Verrucomicrobiae bacterium]